MSFLLIHNSAEAPFSLSTHTNIIAVSVFFAYTAPFSDNAAAFPEYSRISEREFFLQVAPLGVLYPPAIFASSAGDALAQGENAMVLNSKKVMNQSDS